MGDGALPARPSTLHLWVFEELRNRGVGGGGEEALGSWSLEFSETLKMISTMPGVTENKTKARVGSAACLKSHSYLVAHQ